MSLKNYELILNIKRQAKRLSKKLEIPLGRAQENLSTVIYDCGSWGDLRTSVISESFENEYLLLASLHPKSDLLLFKLLNNIITRFNLEFNVHKSNEEVRNIILNVFAIEPSYFKGQIK